MIIILASIILFSFALVINKNNKKTLSIVSGNINAPEKSIIGSMPHVSVLSNGRWLNRSDDNIIYGL